MHFSAKDSGTKCEKRIRLLQCQYGSFAARLEFLAERASNAYLGDQSRNGGFHYWHQIIRGTVRIGRRILGLSRRPTHSRAFSHQPFHPSPTLRQSHSRAAPRLPPRSALLFLTLSS